METKNIEIQNYKTIKEAMDNKGIFIDNFGNKINFRNHTFNDELKFNIKAKTDKDISLVLTGNGFLHMLDEEKQTVIFNEYRPSPEVNDQTFNKKYIIVFANEYTLLYKFADSKLSKIDSYGGVSQPTQRYWYANNYIWRVKEEYLDKYRFYAHTIMPNGQVQQTGQIRFNENELIQPLDAIDKLFYVGKITTMNNKIERSVLAVNPHGERITEILLKNNQNAQTFVNDVKQKYTEQLAKYNDNTTYGHYPDINEVIAEINGNINNHQQPSSLDALVPNNSRTPNS